MSRQTQINIIICLNILLSIIGYFDDSNSLIYDTRYATYGTVTLTIDTLEVFK